MKSVLDAPPILSKPGVMKTAQRSLRLKRFASRSTLQIVVVFLLLFLIAWLLQYYGPTWNNEINVEPDDPAHYVTALMLHDYLRDGLPVGPMRFAEVFYAHYPKVAMGHWPPLFYVVQAAWMLLFGPSIRSDLFLMLLFSVSLATTVYILVRRVLRSEVSAFAAALLLLGMPVMQLYGGTVLADVPVALFAFWAVLFWARFLDTGRIRSVVGFSSMTAVAILTKGNGFALLLVPLLTLFFNRRWDYLKNVRFRLAWLPIPFSMLWSLFTMDLVEQTMLYRPGVSYSAIAIPFYLSNTFAACGACLSLLAVVGGLKVIFDCWRRKTSGLWVSIVALAIAVIALHSIVPIGFEMRYLLMLLPCMVLLAVQGVVTFASTLPFTRFPLARRVDALMLVVVLVFALTTFAIPPKRPSGFAEAASFLTSRPEFAKSVILVSSEGNGEGPFIARVAEFDHQRPNHIVLRASHTFADSSWNSQNYRLLMDSPNEIENYLLSVPIGVIVVDRTALTSPNLHQRLLLQAIHEHPETWKLVAVFPTDPAKRMGEGIEVYRNLGDAYPQHPVVIRAAGTLRRQIVIDPERRPW